MPASNPLNRPLADGIARLGFRKWYERELLSSHAHMLLAVLAVIAMLASAEAMRGAPLHERLLDVLMAIASGGIGYWALRRYMYLLMHAEEMANQASCAACQSYGQLRLADAFNVKGADAPRYVPVCCKRYGHAWDMRDD
ncbi:MAG: hypothetical protein KF871_14700 [Hydrogenophaga sp.]|uniref:hypothetical protein n=1 Tax=Hydrogenophaga sp. TaxID=1904254 RepID=UPI001DC22F47|nr:hypothetical protein [Hydrogenophaga sp.]MBX3611138.1 hypothetical protein [Hydrogenophaga sp.]